MALIDLKSDLKTLKYSEFGTVGDPLVVKDINDPPKYNSISKQVTARTDDLLRMTRLLVLQGGKRNPAGNKFTANLALINQQQTLSKLNKGEKPNFQDIKAGLADTGKTLLGILAQVPVAGTGVHFIYPPAVGNQYLKNSPEGEFSALEKIGAAAGIGSGDGINGAALALQGQKIIPDNEPTAKPAKPEEGTRIQIDFTNDKRDDDRDTGNVVSKLKSRDSNLNSGLKSIISKTDNKKTSATGFFDSEFTKTPESEGIINTRLTTQGDQGKYPGGSDNAVDEINSSDIYESDEFRDKDIIPFEFQIFDPKNGELPRYLYFRAYLESLQDNYSSDWNSTKYIGRAEQLYNYTGFNRDITLSFKVAAHTQKELLPIYKKLNYLAGTTAPSYDTNQTFMRGIFIKLTVGDYLTRVPGFFKSVDLGWSTAYPWEIGLDNLGKENNLPIPKVPHLLDISLTYQPIHNFNPELGKSFITNDEFINS